ncbi:helix-turn-helix transcriptional regulator [Pelagibius litoralis]|uniref:Helix-turn-helix transcriptional regulator n=1 Tax=Pelagibius litoralis TaxID=374515 RepID=A0A967EVF8_9PROT|nr:helix-turn-helix transcriptional regulator [Pelagibius litoralis]NIA68447.1 helix-turn-helix transcriptional regulator [Pelagibius litoralis]
MSFSPILCRAARVLLDWTQTDLAEASGLTRATVANFERGAHEPHPNNLIALQETLEQAGIEFLPETKTKGPGLRVRKQ